MKENIRSFIINFVKEYSKANDGADVWGEPIVKFGNADSMDFEQLRKIVHPEHFIPTEVLEGAKIVIAYFIPYSEKIASSNLNGELNSKEWAMTYETTKQLVAKLEDELVKYIQDKGYKVRKIDETKAFDKELLKSRWSQRHIAKICGLGTFGINHMLITDKGCCGRIGSVVTNLDIFYDFPIELEYCLKKRNGTCGRCIERCPVQALVNVDNGILLCKQQCDKNRQVYNNINTCGKCVVGVPCSLKKP